MAQSTEEAQRRYPRYRDAVEQKWDEVSSQVEAKINSKDFDVAMVAYKEEMSLEVYVKRKDQKQYIKLWEVPFCVLSGELGPKRQQGDLQVPEGLYHIDRFNPASLYHLSLGLNYPNKSDRIRKTGSSTGGDIFIHGDCVSIGCIPITDELIKEVYVLAVKARQNQEKIPVYIFPFKMDGRDISGEHEAFWKELQPFYKKWNTTREQLKFHINEKGEYVDG